MSEAFMNHGRAARFALACLVAAMCLFWGAGAFGHDLESLRSLQKKELDAIEAKYSEKARQVAGNPDGTVNVESEAYRKVEAEYKQQMEKARGKYAKYDPRLPELKRIQKDYDGLIENSGSGATETDAKTVPASKADVKTKDLKPPKDVRADLDLTAKTDEAAKKLVDEWRKNGDYTITYDPKTGKYVSKIHDATIWEPATPERQKARQADADAFVTPGGKKAVGVTGPEAMTDPLGYALDNKQKFQHAREVKDMKTMGKSLSKAAENVGHASPVSRQADALRNYKSPSEVGITRLGESKEVQEQKLKDWTNKAEADLEVAEHKAQQRSEELQEARRNMAEKVEKTAKGNADQNWKDQLGDEPGQSKKSKGGGTDDTAEQVKKRADYIDEANAEAKKRVQGADGQPPKSDAAGKGTADADGSTAKGDADPAAKSVTDVDGDAGAKKTTSADSDATGKGTADADGSTAKGDADPAAKPATDVDGDAGPKKTASADPAATGKGTADADGLTAKGDADPAAKSVTDVDGDAGSKKAASADSEASAGRTKGGDADMQAKSRRPVTDVDTPATPGVPKGDGIAQKGMNAADKADMIIQTIEIGTTVVEGIKEGDAAKAASPILGQDTSERARMKNAYEWAELEGKALDAKDQEVAAELEAKLRRMGATQAEAREARNRYERGDRLGFHENVARIKEKGIKDDGQRALDAGGALQEEDGAKERLKEGARQTGKYVDGFYGGIVEKTENAMAQRKALGAEQDRTQSGIQDDVDNQVVKKMMRMGVPYEEARRAVDLKRSGDSSEFNGIAQRLKQAGVVDPETGTSGLDATGRTDSYEAGDYWKEIRNNAWEMVENKGKTVLRPLDMVYEWYEENNLEKMRNNERAAKFYQVLRGNGVPKDEALEAARAFAEDENSDKVREVYLKYVAGRKGGKAPVKEVAVKHKSLVEYLKSLNHKKMENVFEHLGVAPSQEFLNCLCRSAGYGSPGTAQIYHPDTIGDYNPKYSCNKPGDPCVVSGFGCMRYPLPSDSGIWETCLAANRMNMEKGDDGKVVPDSGQRIDDVLMEKIRDRNRGKTAAAQ
ncbi:hypothetical protein [Desulfomicrobium baculatum]|uniref:Uncharacterized protein n=1 Tax=Desulfomicrobium baculatum (strain DSM 4028 / VKM B-1378 / X) TaxID=525897 RepID=C7LVJ3_DESBD|nr:hypothetical protein [Desulfomicrobium baculatum]ACU89749.1 hypothetical protein Dbac_1657 [Desulfomicrobium baculatum DSM 4028]